MPAFRALVVVVFFLTVGWVVEPSNAHGPKHNPLRHQHVMRHGIPGSYAELRNPLPPTTANLTEGQQLYGENCALCHGEAGQGDGEGAAGLDPAPPSLSGLYEGGMGNMAAGSDGQMMSGQPMMGGADMDAYTFWAVSEGGVPIGSAMPAYKEILSQEERWQVLLYIANGFSTEIGM